jgi:hypothetical protein
MRRPLALAAVLTLTTLAGLIGCSDSEPKETADTRACDSVRALVTTIGKPGAKSDEIEDALTAALARTSKADDEAIRNASAELEKAQRDAALDIYAQYGAIGRLDKACKPHTS